MRGSICDKCQDFYSGPACKCESEGDHSIDGIFISPSGGIIWVGADISADTEVTITLGAGGGGGSGASSKTDPKLGGLSDWLDSAGSTNVDSKSGPKLNPGGE